MNVGAVFFAEPRALWALLPVVLVLVWRVRQVRRRPTLAVPAVGPLRLIAKSAVQKLSWLPFAFGALGLILATLAMARPVARTSTARDVAVEGIDIAIALDLSTSMRAADFKPRDRFHVAKEVLKEFIETRPNDRISLVVFAAEAFTQCPLTLDHNVLIDVLDSLKLGVIEDGTAIGNGLATAINRLRASEAKSKVVILLTDGDNNAGNVSPMTAARMAKELGVRVFPILVGKGGVVPYPQQDAFGRTVFVDVDIPVDPTLLKEIAKEANGAFYNAVDRASLRSSFQDILDGLEKTRLFEAGATARHQELFWWLLWPGLGCLLADVFLRVTRLRRFP